MQVNGNKQSLWETAPTKFSTNFRLQNAHLSRLMGKSAECAEIGGKHS